MSKVSARDKGKTIALSPESRAAGLARLEAHTQRDPNSGCWLWDGFVGPTGYGLLSFECTMYRAHRLAWGIATGIIPPQSEGVIRHTCDVPNCINPDHLRFGTQKDNVADREARGRRAPFHGKIGGRVSVKYSDEAVLEMRLLRAAGVPLPNIATQFGISKHRAGQLTRRGSLRQIRYG